MINIIVKTVVFRNAETNRDVPLPSKCSFRTHSCDGMTCKKIRKNTNTEVELIVLSCENNKKSKNIPFRNLRNFTGKNEETIKYFL